MEKRVQIEFCSISVGGKSFSMPIVEKCSFYWNNTLKRVLSTKGFYQENYAEILLKCRNDQKILNFNKYIEHFKCISLCLHLSNEENAFFMYLLQMILFLACYYLKAPVGDPNDIPDGDEFSDVSIIGEIGKK